MTEKHKKSKKRIPQWQFLLAWIGGQYGAFFGTALLGFLLIIPLNLLGFSIDMLPAPLAFLIVGAALGWFSGWAQQWSIRKHFGHDVKGWRSLSAILTGIAFSLVAPFVIYLSTAQPLLFENVTSYTGIVAVTFMAIFGAAGMGQAILLRKRIKHSWLFFMSTLVGGLIFGLPVLGDSTYLAVQIAQYSVTAFTLLWLFQMSGIRDEQVAEDAAIDRLTDAESDEAWDEYEDDEQDQQYGHLWRRFLKSLRFAFVS